MFIIATIRASADFIFELKTHFSMDLSILHFFVAKLLALLMIVFV